jgi:hypothetical protein
VQRTYFFGLFEPLLFALFVLFAPFLSPLLAAELGLPMVGELLSKTGNHEDDLVLFTVPSLTKP